MAHRTIVALVLVVGTLVTTGARPVDGPPAGAAPLPVAAVDAIGMTVADMDRAVAFYTTVLSFEKVGDREVAGPAWERLTGVFGARSRIVRLRLGQEHIELTEFLAPKGRAMPEDVRPNDRIFQHVAIIVRDIHEAYAHLRRHGVHHASSGPQRLPDWNPNAGGISAFYFRDPDGHFLEILHFPPEKGLAVWQRTDRLFLGIDHTAIVVDDTERSLALYRDTFGMHIAGESENHDTEQEHLNGVFGARLRITALRASEGPGIELLEYLAPRNGRPAPVDLRANDVAHWETTLLTPGPERIFDLVRHRVLALVSPTVVAGARGESTERSVLVRDTDGHALRLTVP